MHQVIHEMNGCTPCIYLLVISYLVYIGITHRSLFKFTQPGWRSTKQRRLGLGLGLGFGFGFGFGLGLGFGLGQYSLQSSMVTTPSQSGQQQSGLDSRACHGELPSRTERGVSVPHLPALRGLLRTQRFWLLKRPKLQTRPCGDACTPRGRCGGTPASTG